jgi:hypothetical protein
LAHTGNRRLYADLHRIAMTSTNAPTHERCSLVAAPTETEAEAGKHFAR